MSSTEGDSSVEETIELTNCLINLDIPHIINDAPCSSHNQSSQTEQGRVEDGSRERKGVDRRGQEDSPGWHDSFSRSALLALPRYTRLELSLTTRPEQQPSSNRFIDPDQVQVGPHRFGHVLDPRPRRSRFFHQNFD